MSDDRRFNSAVIIIAAVVLATLVGAYVYFVAQGPWGGSQDSDERNQEPEAAPGGGVAGRRGDR